MNFSQASKTVCLNYRSGVRWHKNCDQKEVYSLEKVRLFPLRECHKFRTATTSARAAYMGMEVAPLFENVRSSSESIDVSNFRTFECMWGSLNSRNPLMKNLRKKSSCTSCCTQASPENQLLECLPRQKTCGCNVKLRIFSVCQCVNAICYLVRHFKCPLKNNKTRETQNSINSNAEIKKLRELVRNLPGNKNSYKTHFLSDFLA